MGFSKITFHQGTCLQGQLLQDQDLPPLHTVRKRQKWRKALWWETFPRNTHRCVVEAAMAPIFAKVQKLDADAKIYVEYLKASVGLVRCSTRELATQAMMHCKDSNSRMMVRYCGWRRRLASSDREQGFFALQLPARAARHFSPSVEMCRRLGKLWVVIGLLPRRDCKVQVA